MRGFLGLALMLSAMGPRLVSAQQLIEPFTSSARWAHYVHRTYSPARMGLLAADTAVDHLLREPACWDYTAISYGRRYARSLERRVVRNSAELVSGLLTGEDLRYRRSRSRSIRGRAWHAMRSSVTAQMPDGSQRPAYTRFFANELASVSTAYFNGQPIRPGRIPHSLVWSTLDQAQTNLLDEFGPDLRRMGDRIWKRVRPRW